MSETTSSQIPYGQQKPTPTQMIESVPHVKKKFFHHKKVESNSKKNVGFLQQKSKNSKNSKSKHKQIDQLSIESEIQMDKNMNIDQQIETQKPFNQEKTQTNRSIKRKKNELQRMLTEKSKSNKDSTYLKTIIKKNKIDSIVKNFVNKIRRSSRQSEPIQYDLKQSLEMNNIEQFQAIQISPLTQIVLSIIIIVHILAINIYHSLSIVFVQCRSGSYVTFFNVLSFFILILEMIYNFGIVKIISGKKIKNVHLIWQMYPKDRFLIDILSILIAFINIFTNESAIHYFSLIFIFKLSNCFSKIQKVETYFISNLYNQQYWSLIKIIMSNFVFAHIISIILASMPLLNTSQNWMLKKDIMNSPWYQRYIWSYYWGNTIMLTIGFGDIVASNCSEALFLIFIQTFSCLIFAYNINCIGSIMHGIRQSNADKVKKRKIIKKLAQKNDLPEELTWKINNYIIQNAQIKKRFNFEEQREFIISLPQKLKEQYHKESNKKIFLRIQLFSSFLSKTLYNLAENIEIKISHPEQIIQSINDNYNLLILKIGQIAFICKRFKLKIKDLCIDKLAIKQANKESIINLDFILRKRQPYEIKSIEYTIFYYLGYERFIEIIKQSSYDYEYLCSLRDKMKNIPDEFQVFKCNICSGKHLKLNCPKLHYIPYIETVIGRSIHNQKASRNDRVKMQRINSENINPFQNYKRSRKTYNEQLKKGPQKYIIISKKKKINRQTEDILSSKHILMNRQETQVDRQIKKIAEKYKNVNNEIIKEQISKIFKRQETDDEIWPIKLDKSKNYNHYFPMFNPCNIRQKYQGKRFLCKNQLIKLHTEVDWQQAYDKRQRGMSLVIGNLVSKQKKLTV